MEGFKNKVFLVNVAAEHCARADLDDLNKLLDDGWVIASVSQSERMHLFILGKQTEPEQEMGAGN